MNKRVLLIDADSVAYRAAASAEGLSPDIAIARAYGTIKFICETVPDGYSHHEIILSGEHNFRKGITSEYKSNRIGVRRPTNLPDVVCALRGEGNAIYYDGFEGDDTIGIRRTYWLGHEMVPVICGLDKDLRQFPGFHYDWVKRTFSTLDDRMALSNFYTQFILGDRSDNIGGFDGIKRSSIPKFLAPIIQEIVDSNTEEEMLEIVRRMYNYEDFRVLLNGNLLYLLRHEGDYWCPEVLKDQLELNSIQEREALLEYLSSQGTILPNISEPTGESQTSGFPLPGTKTDSI